MNQKSKNLILLTTSAVLSMHIINRITYSLSTVKNLLNCTENNYYEWRFGKIRYLKKGSGNPILLLHDLTPGSSNYEYNKIINELSKTCEVYAIDLLGYGLSDKPNITYTNYLYVQLLVDFIKNVIGKRTDIITSGESAPIAIMTCHNDPEVINQMLLINPPNINRLNIIPSKHTKILKLILDMPIIGTFIYNVLTHRKYIEKDFREKYFYNEFNIKEDDILSYIEAAHTPDYNSKYAYASYVGKYTNANIIHALKEVNHNIILVGGEAVEDIDTVMENYISFNNAIEKVLIPESKSLPHLEKPNKILEYIKLYLNK